MTKTELRALAMRARRHGTYYAGPGKAFVFCPLASRAGVPPESIYVVTAPSKQPRAADFDRAVIEHITDEYADGEPACKGRAELDRQLAERKSAAADELFGGAR